jgi:multidrug efflux pump subunit AcrB
MKNLLAKFVGNSVHANIVMATLLIAGIAAAFLMIREEMPNVSFDRIVIKASFPGADPEEVEEGISRKIEESIKGLEGIKTYTSTSVEGMSETQIEIDEGYDGQVMLDRVRTKIDSISNFPGDAEKPIVTLPLHAKPVMGLYLNGAVSEKGLKSWSYKIKDQLLDLDQVSQVSLFGIRDYEINVEVSESKLRKYGISFSQVAEAIRRSNLNRSGGTIKNTTNEIRIRTIGRKYTDEQLASIVVMASSDGDLITLDKLTIINDAFSEDSILSTVNGKSAVILSIFKTSEEDAIEIADSVNGFIDNLRNSTPPGTQIGVLFDNSNSIRHQVNILVKNGVAGLVLVFIILWLFLSARLSLWTGMGIIISVVGGIAVVWVIGGTINMISIFGFIMVLGIVADDAIVVGESIAWHRKQGKTAFNAAVDGVMEVGIPVLAAVLTTVLAFIPLMFIDGVMGKLISILPIVVIACLFLSLFESFAILPAHLSHLPGAKSETDPKAKSKNFLFNWFNWIPTFVGKGLENFTQKIYSPILEKLILWRYAFLCFSVGLLLVSVGIIQGGFLKFELLPNRDGFYLTSIVEFPEGTSLQITEKAVKEIENAILRISKRTETKSGDPLVNSILAISGQAPKKEPGELGATGHHLGGVQVILLDSDKRGVDSNQLVKLWQKEVGSIIGVKALSFSGTIMGHPGKPIEIGIDGHNLNQIISVVDELKTRLKQYQGVFDIQSDHAKGKDEIQFSLKPEARTLGVTVQDLADQIYTGYFGKEVLRIQRGRDDVKIRVRYTSEERQSLTSLDNFRIRTTEGYEVPLNVVADAKWVPGSSAINRTDGFRRVTVSADVDSAVIYADEVIQDLSNGFFETIKATYPGIKIVLDGDAGETEASFDTMFFGFILAILAIYMLIATLFRSYLQPLVILVTIPFGLIGVIWGHIIMGWDLTMISMFGMVGLTGIVVNDAIVLVERINANIKDGIPFLDAVRLGGIRRFRAVFLTSVTTVGGLAPLIFETDSYATMLIPMAITIVFGIIFATVLTLLLIPCLLVILNDFRLLVSRVSNGEWKMRNQVEPARLRNLQDEIIKNSTKTEVLQS